MHCPAPADPARREVVRQHSLGKGLRQVPVLRTPITYRREKNPTKLTGLMHRWAPIPTPHHELRFREHNPKLPPLL